VGLPRYRERVTGPAIEDVDGIRDLAAEADDHVFPGEESRGIRQVGKAHIVNRMTRRVAADAQGGCVPLDERRMLLTPVALEFLP
jgi:hypothetical protein